MELNKRVGFGLLGQRPRSPENVMTTTVRAHGGQGPEYHALSAALAELELSGKYPDDSASDAKITEKLDRALGQAVARCWSKLGPEIQQTLFEAAVQAEGERMRQALAMHLHDNHERTVQSVQAKAMPEPDSLGG
jgi:hypothetical protein